MRWFEFVLIAACLPQLTSLLAHGTAPGWTKWASLVGLALLAGQFALEGVRWALLPTYIVIIVMLAASVWPALSVLSARWSAAAGIAMLFASAGMCHALPVFTLPRPTGTYAVGSTIIPLVDSTRNEEDSRSPDQHREILTQIWYPSDSRGTRQQYRTQAEVTLVKQQLAMVKTNASSNVPIATTPEQFPVVVFSPSWIGRRNQNTVQAEELASHGFIVIGLDHPYGTELTVFPDGRRISTNLGEMLDFSTDESLASSIRSTEHELIIRVADVRFVLTELENPSPTGPLAEIASRADFARIGVFGHSFGGAVATEACLQDSRIKCGVNIDGLIFGRALSNRVVQPFMYISDSTPVPSAAQVAAARGSQFRNLNFIRNNEERIIASLPPKRGYLLSIRGASHMNLCDSALYSPIRRLTNAGSIRPERAMEIVNAYLLAFFDSTLRDHSSNLLKGPTSPFPEVRFERDGSDLPSQQ